MAGANRNSVSDNLRSYYLNLGLNPDAAYTGGPPALVGTSGISWAFNRATDRMLEGQRLGGPGARMVYNVDEQNADKALHTGSGSVYDNPATGGENYVAPSWATPEAGLSRLNHSTALRDARLAAQKQQQQFQADAAAAQQRAYTDQVSKIRQSNDFLSNLPPDLQQTYGRLTPQERSRVLDAGTTGGYAMLAGSSLRPRQPITSGGSATVMPGRQTDFLSAPLQIPGFNQYQAYPPSYRGGGVIGSMGPRGNSGIGNPQAPSIPRPTAELGQPNNYGFEDKLSTTGMDDSMRTLDRGF